MTHALLRASAMVLGAAGRCWSLSGGSPAPTAPTSTCRRCDDPRGVPRHLVRRPARCDDVLPSLVRLAVGYALALVVGVARRRARSARTAACARSLEPVLEFLRAIPPPVLVPILILFAGIDDLMKVLVIVSGCVWPILLNTVEGVRGADEVLADTCRSYRHPRLAAAAHASCCGRPSPQIVTGARQALSIGIILMVISEMLRRPATGSASPSSQFQRGFQIPEMWSGVLLLGLHRRRCCPLLFRLVERRVLAWYHGVRAAERGPRCRGDPSVLEIRGLAQGLRRPRPAGRGAARHHASTWPPASSSASSARPAAARRRCCAASAGCSTPTARRGPSSAAAPVTGPPAGLAVVFQEYGRSLFPWLTGRARTSSCRSRRRACRRRERAALVRRGAGGGRPRRRRGRLPVAALRRHAAAGGDRPGAWRTSRGCC